MDANIIKISPDENPYKRIAELEAQLSATETSLTELRRQLAEPSCYLADFGRGDCLHFIGLPDVLDETTMDHYGKPNDWCWWCWGSYQRTHLEFRLAATTAALETAEGLISRCEALIIPRGEHDSTGLYSHIRRLMAALEALQAERGCYKAVLIGAEFERVDELPSRGQAFCTVLGIAAAQRMKETKAKLASETAILDRLHALALPVRVESDEDMVATFERVIDEIWTKTNQLITHKGLIRAYICTLEDLLARCKQTATERDAAIHRAASVGQAVNEMVMVIEDMRAENRLHGHITDATSAWLNRVKPMVDDALVALDAEGDEDELTRNS